MQTASTKTLDSNLSSCELKYRVFPLFCKRTLSDQQDLDQFLEQWYIWLNDPEKLLATFRHYQYNHL